MSTEGLALPAFVMLVFIIAVVGYVVDATVIDNHADTEALIREQVAELKANITELKGEIFKLRLELYRHDIKPEWFERKEK